MKPTQALARSLRRHALSTKQTNKGYYKGTGSGSMGRHDKHGGYVIEWEKVRTYVVPKELADTKLTPFVKKSLYKPVGMFKGYPKGAFDGKAYLDKWKAENGET